ncbi:hypothetical protein ACFJIW_02685 [Tahibacter sp. UC22_41]|uniref:hypothetical protein n=1 Tax=Tahibacter sp. UC22_41 TaxID=3350178 RepID=UPI0036DA2B93
MPSFVSAPNLRALLFACLFAAFAPAAPAQNQDGNFDRSFNARASWYGAPGWATMPFDHPGRSRHDTAQGLRLLRDGSFVVFGLAGRSASENNNGLLAGVKLNGDGSPHAFWSSPEDQRGGTLSGRITWPYLFDNFTVLSAGYNPGGDDGMGIAGSGRMAVGGTFVNRARYFGVAPGGATIGGGAGSCELYAGAALRDFYALGANSRYYDSAVIAGYVRRYGDQAFLPADCELGIGQTRTRSVSDSLPSSPASVIGATSVLPHYVGDSTNYLSSRRLYRNFNSAADNDVELCNPGFDYSVSPPRGYGNCSLFQPNLGGHLDDLLYSVIPDDGFVTGLIESQIALNTGSGDDRRVLTLARAASYSVNEQGSVSSRPSIQRSFPLGDATGAAETLSFHFPRGVVDGRNGTTLWVVMALRRFPGPDDYREIAVARFNYFDLTLDTRFGNGTGWRRYSLGGKQVIPNAIRLDNQGRLVIAGAWQYNPDNDDWDYFVMRINDDVLFANGFQ